MIHISANPSYYRNIFVAFQDEPLFPGTLKEILLCGVTEEATERERGSEGERERERDGEREFGDTDIKIALERADLRDFFLSLPHGLNTFIQEVRERGEEEGGREKEGEEASEGSVYVSEAQRQKIQVARMYLRKSASLYLLDEPLCALNGEERVRVIQNMKGFVQVWIQRLSLSLTPSLSHSFPLC